MFQYKIFENIDYLILRSATKDNVTDDLFGFLIHQHNPHCRIVVQVD